MAAMTTQSEAQRRAIARALARGGASAVKRVRYGLYRVESNSRPGLRHTVSVDSQGLYHCDCEAGLVGRPCWHAGAVYIAKVEHGSGRVTGPAVPLAPVGAGVAQPVAPVQSVQEVALT